MQRRDIPAAEPDAPSRPARSPATWVVRTALRLFALLASLGAPALAGPTGTIALRPAARVRPNAPVLLSDVATLTGAPALALADITVLAGATEAWHSLDAAAVRAAIDEQADPVWGHLALLGDQCRVRAVATPNPRADDAPGTDAPEPPTTDPTTIRAVVERRLAVLFACDVSDLSLEFSDRDAPLLTQSAIGRTVNVQPTGFSDRLPLRITVYDADRLLSTAAIRVTVLVRRDVAVTPAALPRGHILSPADLIPESRWLPPDMRPLPIDHAPGLILKSRLEPGQPVSISDVESPILARRGQTLQVHCADGAVSLQIPARALQDGREGDIIRCVTIESPRLATSRSTRSTSRAARPPPREFLARVAAPGIAVAVTGERDRPADTASTTPLTPDPPFQIESRSNASGPSEPTPGIAVNRTGPLP